jgi:hypothetical protein
MCHIVYFTFGRKDGVHEVRVPPAPEQTTTIGGTRVSVTRARM